MSDVGGGLVMREYRKGNWTLNETMVLIEAKKMDDERRMRRSIGLVPATDQPQDNRSSKPGELRWKWIEDYCWRKGCMRSQNQCNDKWDNLMRDYKKVREYERRRVESSFDPQESSSSTTLKTPSYWKMEKSERKERSLPSNMLPQTYQALHEVVETKNINIPPSSSVAAASAVSVAVGSGNGSGGGQIQSLVHQNLGYVPMRAQLKQQISPSVMLSLPPPPQPPQPPSPPLLRPVMMPQQPPLPLSFHAQPIQPTKDNSSDSDTSDYSETTPAKRRRKTPAETTTATATAGPSGEGGGAEEEETTMGAALWKSASVIAEALKENEERQEKRHKELLNLQERRLKIEESNAKMNKQGMDGLVEAINKLATSIFTLASSSSSSREQEQGAPP